MARAEVHRPELEEGQPKWWHEGARLVYRQIQGSRAVGGLQICELESVMGQEVRRGRFSCRGLEISPLNSICCKTAVCEACS